ncbi:mitochondrial 54S ribosomal protein bL32m [Dipodascopsis tothii]|uniref:mitochondrial 54S ribosomal protein bL32m n=1 Tax=Dipodascopsis tothii TaxID=44089 RepID=UPI0034CD861C
MASIGSFSLPRLAGLAGAGSALLRQPITLRIPVPAALVPQAGGGLFGGLAGWLEDNGLVLGAPKKKASLQKRRQRQLAPGSKQVKPEQALSQCPSCGSVKRMHTVCQHCHGEIRQLWRAEARAERQAHAPAETLLDVAERDFRKHTAYDYVPKGSEKFGKDMKVSQRTYKRPRAPLFENRREL